MSAHTLKPYFQAHPVIVLTNVPLHQVMHKPDLTGCMTKCVLELSKYQVKFQPWHTMQAQGLAGFVMENTLRSAMEPGHGDSA